MASYEDYGASSPQDLESNGRHHKESSRDSLKDKEMSKDSHKEREHREHKHRDRDSESKSRSDKHHRDHGSDRHRSRDRDRDRDKERDRDRDRERDRDRDRRSRDRSREKDRRHHDYDSDRERRHRRHRSRSRSRSRSEGKSRDRPRSPSRSRSRERSKRTSGFDMAPPGVNAVPGMTTPGQLPGVTPAVPNMMPDFAFPGMQMAALSAMPMQAMTQQAMKHARRVYVGGLPPTANEQTIAAFFSHVMQMIGGNSAPGDAVVNVYINHEKKFAFVEMRTVEEASNAMALDGILFEGMPVRVRRPTDYNPSLSASLGPSQPSPNLNLAAVGLQPGVIGGAEGPDKIFVGGLPYYLTETQIKELLESFGPLRGFDLVKDRETGNSKGYAFCVYQDPAVTDVACAALNGLKMGDKTLTVRRATAGGQPKPDQENVLLQAQQQIAMQKLVLQATATSAYGLMPGLPLGNGNLAMESPTNVLCLTNLVSVDELRDDQEFEDIYQDVGEECSKYGKVVNLVIPRPSPTDENVPGLGKAFVEYEDTQGSSKARSALNGRKFAGNTVIAVYYPEEKFASGDLNC